MGKIGEIYKDEVKLGKRNCVLPYILEEDDNELANEIGELFGEMPFRSFIESEGASFCIMPASKKLVD